jgi:hypothetical protein
VYECLGTTEVFSLFDKDEDGAIRVNEIGPILRSIGFNPSEVQIQQLIREYDDGGKRINCDFSVLDLSIVMDLTPPDVATDANSLE